MTIFACSVFNLNNKKVNALIARELSGFTCTRSLTMNEKFFNTALGNFSFIVIELAQVNPDNSLGECVNLQLNYEAKPRGFRPDKTRAASFLNGFKNIPEKA